jgi:hypothetical protein
MVEQVLFLGDLFEQWPQLTALAEEIIVGVDQEKTGVFCPTPLMRRTA